jgi:EpsI family protein
MLQVSTRQSATRLYFSFRWKPSYFDARMPRLPINATSRPLRVLAVVTYWYQTPRRVVAGEWPAKFWLAADALRDRRTDTALVRIFVWTGKGGDTEATDAAVRFTKSLYPLLRDYLPR